MLTRALLLLTLGLQAGCMATPARPEAATPVPTTTTLQQAISAARADAARRFGAPGQSLELVSAADVTWPDGSLGCPQPDRRYTQAIVPGYRVRLKGPAGLLDYHLSARGGLVLCPADRSTDPLPGNSRT